MTNDRYRQTGLKFYQFKDDSDTPEIIRLMHYDEEKHEYKVMKDGNIVEVGSHDELIEKGGVYKDLYTSQFESGEDF